jgi:AcrR family transcriptional regulator
LLLRLTEVFRSVGYEGASLAMLSSATGLKRASLYHRFPGGKQQMAEEVLLASLNYFDQAILRPLNQPGLASDRLQEVIVALDTFYAGGKSACLLNLFAVPPEEKGPFTQKIHDAFSALLQSFAKLAEDAGLPKGAARERAEETIMLIEGALIMTRGLRDHAPFGRMLKRLPRYLIPETTALKT